MVIYLGVWEDFPRYLSMNGFKTIHFLILYSHMKFFPEIDVSENKPISRKPKSYFIKNMQIPHSPYFLLRYIAWRVNLSGYLTKGKPPAVINYSTMNLEGFESFLNLIIFPLRIKPNGRNCYFCHLRMRWNQICGIEGKGIISIFIYTALLLPFPKNLWLLWKSPLRKEHY